ncbi:nitroreductase [Clostridium pasteurianum DSM 525 = ATCC 6013]|uniref:Nitroreductase n=1 Tax=Clostridium pasteurianum DSM 525 = ATCC 6013 TaxID=1262449 RepID=A0A0H3J181_CLOPA|nr:nitroreductase family protein [Clostridium pasteurianum]AJA46467.1 nitroreductase [Clostridium pasteurianum DSM 525 = ATCC 6013]AJA50455.1 nitroreductase [Clostridium pasteurianum DSM 525 = ATCC 6013]AOZ73897.1 nitroreductase [Clostridium pasteurianum DSM 525 = ATCC 6013]AOZ77694.1 nitroreductase [Clostridium pasteurianum]ELP61041.1 nitroreductase [Clostridium pasteurianum DSM 525 = ATCC 6013]
MWKNVFSGNKEKNFFDAVATRRTFYGISKESPVSDERIQEIIEHAVKHTPSSFNSQSARVVLFLGKNHDKLWDITKEALRKIVPPENFAETESKIDSFKNGYGTILFFEDNSVIEALQNQFALYKDNFPIWSQQSSGMHQYVIWTSLELEGLGASLQHYNELIEAEVKKEWGILDKWKLIAQMPFGKPTEGPGEKEYKPLGERIKVFK